MPKNFAVIVAALCLATASAATVFWRKSEALKQENQALAAKTAELEKFLEQARAEGKRAAEQSGEGVNEMKRDLMRLRNDVTQLRASEEAANKVRSENQKLQAEVQKLRKEIATRVALPPQAPVQQAFNPGAQPGTPDPAQDPIAFYRKNPELMKRYFPHLVAQEQAATNAPAQ